MKTSGGQSVVVQSAMVAHGKRLEVSSVGTGLQLTSANQTGINANSAALAGTTEVWSTGGTLPVAQWDCLEWEFNDAPDQIRAFLNGSLDIA